MVAWPIEPLAESPSVLITDDNDAWRQVVEDILARAGFRTTQAACGEEAIEVVRTGTIDIVLRLDGLQTLRIIRAGGSWQPAVIMTAHPDQLPAAETEALRVESVLTKPAERQVIVTTITRIVWRNV